MASRCWLGLLLLALIDVNRLASGEVQDSRCGKQVENDSGGTIKSHANYGKRLYPLSLTCEWSLTPPGDGRGFQLFPLAMSLEYSPDCSLDYLEIIEEPSGKSLGRFCGAEIFMVSSRSRLKIVFHADSSFNKEGFALAYKYVPVPSTTNITRMGRACFSWEARCADGKTCIRRHQVCDGRPDCPGGSEEESCSTMETGGGLQGQCGLSQRACSSGQCVPKQFWCNGRRECPDGSDESECQFAPSHPQIRCNYLDCYEPNTDLSASDLSSVNRGDASSQPQAMWMQPSQPSADGSTDTGDMSSSPAGTCGRQRIPVNMTERIVNGEIAAPGSWPWQVSLRFNGQHICGGTILNSRWILTASHCVYGRTNPGNWRVDAGRFRLNGMEDSLQAARVIFVTPYPAYDPQRVNNDVAVMKIDRDLQWTPQVQPACLPRSVQEEPQAGTWCYVTGWGDTQGTPGAGFLKQARIPVVDKNLCNQWYRGAITNSMMCAGYEGGGVDACQGDSGGPFVCQEPGSSTFTLLGVVSWGNGCAQPRQPGIYTNLVRFMPWVSQYMSQ